MRLSAVRRRGGRAWVWLVAGLLVGGGAGAGAVYMMNRVKEGKGIPGGLRLGKVDELAMIPPDAAGFVHVRARDIWKSETLADVRAIVDRAGADALAELDAGFAPAPSSLDRVTVVFLPAAPVPKKGAGGPPPGRFGGPDDGPGLPFDLPAGDLGNAVVVLAFAAPFDAARVRQSVVPGAVARAEKGKEYYADRAAGLGACFPSDTTLVLGSPAAVEQFVRMQPEGEWKDIKPRGGVLAEAVTLAAEGGRHLVAGVNIKQLGGIPPRAFDRLFAADPAGPDDLRGLADHLKALAAADAAAVGVVLAPGDIKVDIRLGYETEAKADAAMTAVKPLADFARKKLDAARADLRTSLKGRPGGPDPRPVRELPEAAVTLLGLGVMNKVDGYLADPPVKRDGTQLVATIEVPAIGAALVGTATVGVGLLLPATQKVREAAGRMKDSNNLKQIGLAMHNYHDIGGFFPQDITDKTGKPLLSWRVAILPYIDQDALYKQFRLDEPWDSPHNRKLLAQMPPTYASPLAADPPGRTRYKAFAGPGAAFERGKKMRITDFTDGTSNTILVTGGGPPVDWTKPDDVPFSGPIVPMVLAVPGKSGCNMLFADGSVRWMELGTMTPQKLTAMITRNGGEVIDW